MISDRHQPPPVEVQRKPLEMLANPSKGITHSETHKNVHDLAKRKDTNDGQ